MSFCRDLMNLEMSIKMEKTKFHNKAFEYSLIALLVILFLLSTPIFVSFHLKALIPLTIHGLTLILVFLKNKHTKFGITFWSAIMIISQGVSFLAKVGKVLLGGEIQMLEILKTAFLLIVGILVYFLNEKYVSLTKVD